MKSSSFTLQGAGMLRLNGHNWRPSGQPIGVVVLLHGLGEHMGRYQQLGAFFASRGISLWGCDLQGHGKSQGKRGHANYKGLLQDVDTLLQRIGKEEPAVPVFLYGHSMGGNIVLNYILNYSGIAQEVEGLILSAPWIRLKMKTPVWALALSQVVNLVYPQYTRENGLDPSWLSKDPQVCAAYREDPLVHRRISAGLFLSVHQKGRKALKNAERISLPTLVMHGTRDPITSYEGSKELVGKLPDVQWKQWKGLLHEPHNELEKEEVMEFVFNWVKAKIKSAKAD